MRFQHGDLGQTGGPKQVLLTARMIWAALLGGQVIFAFIVAYVIDQDMTSANPDLNWILFGVAAALLVTEVPIMFFLRSRTFKAGLREGLVAPPAYLTGNILAWAGLEAVGLMGLVGCLVSGTLMPNLIPAAVALTLLGLLWPDGKAMLPEDAQKPYRREDRRAR